MARPGTHNFWAPLDSNDFDTALALLGKVLSRPKFGKGKALSNWKASKNADTTWCPDTYWCYECAAGGFGRGISTLHGPVCDWCRAPIDDRSDMRRLNGFAPGSGYIAPRGSEFWTWEDWEAYNKHLEDYYDSITPDCE